VSRVLVAPVSFGLGDLVVSLPAIQAVIAESCRQGDETWLVARSPSQALLSERIEGLAGILDEQLADESADGARFVDLRDHPLQRDHWWGTPEFEAAHGPLSINEILLAICRDLGVAADFSRPAPLLSFPRPGLQDTVVLVADSDGPDKRWPLECWASLAAGVRDTGAGVAALTRGASPGQAVAGIAPVCAPTPGDAVDVLSSCRAVVGIDTGMTHIAVQQGTPTVTLCRPQPVFFRPWPHCRAVTGASCDPACVALERQHAHHETVRLPGAQWSPWTCGAHGRCMAGIRPEDAIDALCALL
jgi:ADP-heptose:LPS heptosyltransferase